MSREIKFRGMDVGSGEWVEGWYAEIDGAPFIFIPYRLGKSCSCCDACDCEFDSIESSALVAVIPETIGQYTGAMFTNVKVYPGDILRDSVGAIFLVEWDGFAMSYIARLYFQGMPRKIEMLAAFNQNTTEVIGDIHTSPKLLEPK